jgi:DICT domain-containing protein
MVDTWNFSVARLVDESAVENIFTARTDLMMRWSSDIEKAIISHRLTAPLYVGVQHLRQFKPILNRYRRIATFAQGIWVFGQPDAEHSVVKGIHFISLQPADLMVHEWFLVVNASSYARALVAREVVSPGASKAQRLFRGVLTSDRNQITQITSALADFVSNR